MNKMASKILSNKEFRLTFVIMHPKSNEIFEALKLEQKEYRDLNPSCNESLQRFRAFKSALSAKLKTQKDYRRLIKRFELRYYSGIIPRHFIVKLDTNLYVGSFLSQSPSPASCLLKLIDTDKGCLYDFFDKEVTHIKDHSEKIVLKDIKKNPKGISRLVAKCLKKTLKKH